MSGEKTMKVFEIVKTVLNEEYESVFPKAERDARIGKALKDLSVAYSKVKNRGGPPLSDPAVRFAYIYKYATAHANTVFDAIINNDQLKKIFDQENVKIACVGGGHGSDLLGIYKYVLMLQHKPNMMFYLLDRDDAWSESWSEVDSMTKATIPSSTMFRHIDVCNKTSWEVHKKFLTSDLFTFVYFISEIFSCRIEATAFFQNLFQKAKNRPDFSI